MTYKLTRKVACILFCFTLGFLGNLYAMESNGLPKVRVRGRQFYAGGAPLVFHGVQHNLIARSASRSQLERHPGQDPVGDYYRFSCQAWFDESDAVYLESIGVNLLRLRFEWNDYNDSLYVELYEHLFDVCAEHGIYVMLAMTPPGGWGDGSALWGNDELKVQFASAWGDIAELTRRRSEVAIYDLQNEPYPPSEAEYTEVCIMAKEAIRQYTDKPIAYAFPFGGVHMPPIAAFADSQAVGTWHYYAPTDFTHQYEPGSVYPGVIAGEYWDMSTIQETLRRRHRNWLLENTCPVVLGEFGARESCPSGRAQWVEDVRILHEDVTPPISWEIGRAHV